MKIAAHAHSLLFDDQSLCSSIFSAHSLSELGVASEVAINNGLFTHILYNLSFNKEAGPCM